MRPGQNRRMRGRTRNKGPNPLTKAYESNGPDVKIRGTAQHVADKYAQLARDAQVSGDPVAAENYLQHAEHYYRLIAAVQEQYRQQFGTGPRPFDDEGEDGDEDAGPGGYPQQRFDRGQGGQPGGDDYGESGSQPQPYESRPDGDRAPRFDRGDRFDRGERESRPERFENRADNRDNRDSNRSERDGNRGERDGNRGDRPDRGERPRFPRPDRPPRQDFQRSEGPRAEGPRDERPRSDGPREERPRSDAPREERQARPDFNRERPRRDRDDAGPAPEQPAGLPAFLTNPVRPPIAVDEGPSEAPVNGTASEFAEDGVPPSEGANGTEVNGAAYAPRPRRRRRPRFEGSSAGAEAPEFNPDNGDVPPVE